MTLYLVGHQMPGPVHEAYTDEVRALAAKVGNVEILSNIGGAQLKALMKTISVVWSFTGGVAPNENPADAEHFGIAVVEAMSAGAIPVLVDRGGLREIVNESPDHLCSSLDEFAVKTLRFFELGMAEQREQRRRARALAERFTEDQFNRRFQAIF